MDFLMSFTPHIFFKVNLESINEIFRIYQTGKVLSVYKFLRISLKCRI